MKKRVFLCILVGVYPALLLGAGVGHKRSQKSRTTSEIAGRPPITNEGVVFSKLVVESCKLKSEEEQSKLMLDLMSKPFDVEKFHSLATQRVDGQLKKLRGEVELSTLDAENLKGYFKSLEKILKNTEFISKKNTILSATDLPPDLQKIKENLNLTLALIGESSKKFTWCKNDFAGVNPLVATLLSKHAAQVSNNNALSAEHSVPRAVPVAQQTAATAPQLSTSSIIEDIISKTRANKFSSCISVKTNLDRTDGGGIIRNKKGVIIDDGKSGQYKPMPLGYQKFMAWNFVKNMCLPASKFVHASVNRKNTSDALTSGNFDYFDSTPDPKNPSHQIKQMVSPFVRAYGVLYGLGAQESSGNPLAAADLKAKDTRPWAREAGLFQLSASCLLNNPEGLNIFKNYLEALDQAKNNTPADVARICQLNDPKSKPIFNDSEYFNKMSVKDRLWDKSYIVDSQTKLSLLSEKVMNPQVSFDQIAEAVRPKSVLIVENSSKRIKKKFGGTKYSTALEVLISEMYRGPNQDPKKPKGIREKGFLDQGDRHHSDKGIVTVDAFRRLAWYCPAMSTEIALTVARMKREHNGPLIDNTKTGHPEVACVAMFNEIYSRKAEICGAQ